MTLSIPRHRSRVMPSQSILTGRPYVPSHLTNVAATIAAARAALAAKEGSK